MTDGNIKFGFDIAGGGRQFSEIKKLRIEEVSRHRIAQRGQHRSAQVRDFSFEILDESFDARPFQVWLRAAKITGNDGELCFARELREVTFAAEGQRPNNRVATVV